jgi:N-acetylmuramoyl-L-alanine amidase
MGCLELNYTRRQLLRLMAAGAAVGWALDQAAAQPAGRHTPPVARAPTVVIDPGHGGVDPGAISANGTCEKDIVLSTAWHFARLLAATHRYRVMLTRSGDEFIPLRDRVSRARAWQANLFLSIHADALRDAGMRGLSVFTLSAQASDREVAALAIRENQADLVDGINLARQPRAVEEVLVDLARRQTDNSSIRLARDIVDELGRGTVLLDHPRRSADLAVLTAPGIPSVLVELGCLSNPREERLLRQPAYQHKLALGLVRAVDGYFAVHSAK